MDVNTRSKITSWLKEPDTITLRVSCANERITDAILQIWDEQDRHLDYVKQGDLVNTVYTEGIIHKLLKQIRKDLREVRMFREPSPLEEEMERMIEDARNVPFENLHDFKRNMAFCPFHNNTRTPAMSLKNNKVHCFVCNRTWDTIDFVMEKEGLSFREAVRRLCA